MEWGIEMGETIFFKGNILIAIVALKEIIKWVID